MNKDNELTDSQRRVLDSVTRYIEQNGMPPTIREIMADLKLASPRSVQVHLAALEEKGYIDRDSRTSRSIKLKQSLSQKAAGAVNGIAADLADKITSIPLLGRIPAGGPMLAEENIEEWVTLPTELTKGKRDVFILRAQGDSMIGAGIFDGDLLIVQPQETAENGDIVAALIGDDATVKRLIKRRDATFLKAENPKYSNIYPDEQWKVQGKVMAVVRQNVK